MTQEEKARAYDEAVEKAKKLMVTSAAYDKFTIEKIFPELRESEDERIRKEIISALKWANHKGVYDKHIAWLEKQSSNVDNANKEYWRGYREGKQEILDKYAELEKQVDQKPANKIEPKFKVGDWITDGEKVWKIGYIEDDTYIEHCDSISAGGFIESIDKHYHLWTIKDAKDGDVLAVTMYPEGIWIGIFKEQNGCTFSSHCFVNTKGIFKLGKYNHGNGKAIHPATKEQRAQLFQKMKEAGYTFDFEEKKLKGLEKIEIPLSAKDSELQETTYFIPKGFHAEIDADKVVIKKGKQNPTDEEMIEALRTEYEKGRADAISEMQVACSEEDIATISRVISIVKWAAYSDHSHPILNDEGATELVERLNAIKDKCTWKPSEEQMKALRFVKNAKILDPDERESLNSLYIHLKKLK